MTRFASLKKEARAAATFRGHDLGKFRTITDKFADGVRGIATCRTEHCGANTCVSTRTDDAIELWGEAVAINCRAISP